MPIIDPSHWQNRYSGPRRVASSDIRDQSAEQAAAAPVSVAPRAKKYLPKPATNRASPDNPHKGTYLVDPDVSLEEWDVNADRIAEDIDYDGPV